jgi:hypothetical protein
MSMLAAPDTITGPLRAEDLDRDTNPGNVWLLPRRAAVAQCPPCTGDCRQGRDCPGPDTIPTDMGALDDSAAVEGGRHADPVESMLQHRRTSSAVKAGLALAALLAVVGFASRLIWPLA